MSLFPIVKWNLRNKDPYCTNKECRSILIPHWADFEFQGQLFSRLHFTDSIANTLPLSSHILLLLLRGRRRLLQCQCQWEHREEGAAAEAESTSPRTPSAVPHSICHILRTAVIVSEHATPVILPFPFDRWLNEWWELVRQWLNISTIISYAELSGTTLIKLKQLTLQSKFPLERLLSILLLKPSNL